jgi:hypothetical protein
MASVYSTHVPDSGSGGSYLKIKDGQKVKVRFASEPAIFQSESKPDEHGNTRLSTRYGWLIWNQDEQVAQTFEQSATFFKNLAVLAQDEEWGDPMGYDINITRKGEMLETTYTLTPSANREPLSKAAKDELASIDLIAALSASPYAQNVMWLSEFGKPNKQAEAAIAKPDTVIEDIGDEPINLDDIPF